MEMININQTSDNKGTIVEDMLGHTADLLIMRTGGVAAEIIMMVHTFINLSIKLVKRGSYIPESV